MSALSNHVLALGSCIAGVGVLMTGLLALLFRDPNAPRWTRPEIVAMLICVPVAVITGLGLGYVALGLSRLVGGTGDPRELLVLVGVVTLLVLAWRVLRIGQRLKDYATARGDFSASASLATEPTLGIDETPPPPRKPRAPRPNHRAA
jgi:hypothetical protein